MAFIQSPLSIPGLFSLRFYITGIFYILVIYASRAVVMFSTWPFSATIITSCVYRVPGRTLFSVSALLLRGLGCVDTIWGALLNPRPMALLIVATFKHTLHFPQWHSCVRFQMSHVAHICNHRSWVIVFFQHGPRAHVCHNCGTWPLSLINLLLLFVFSLLTLYEQARGEK